MNINRTAILIDIENFNGGPIHTRDQVKWCRTAIENFLRPSESDLIMIAVDTTAISHFGGVWQDVRLLTGHGHNGADLQLMKVLEEENLPERFTNLTLVSGDRIYAEKIAALAGQGLPTHVYSHPKALSPHLRLAATSVTTDLFPNHPDARKAS